MSNSLWVEWAPLPHLISSYQINFSPPSHFTDISFIMAVCWENAFWEAGKSLLQYCEWPLGKPGSKASWRPGTQFTIRSWLQCIFDKDFGVLPVTILNQKNSNLLLINDIQWVQQLLFCNCDNTTPVSSRQHHSGLKHGESYRHDSVWKMRVSSSLTEVKVLRIGMCF